MRFYTRVLGILLGLGLWASVPLVAAEQELVFWNFWDQKLILPVIAEFEKEHPEIHIRSEQLTFGNGFDKIVVALANGLEPDICELGSTWTGRFMAAGVLQDLTDQLKDLSGNYLLWEAATWKDRLYGIPWMVSTRVLFYNRQLFREAGLNPDQPPETWDELVSAARKIHRPDRGIFGIGVNAGEGHILYKKFLPFVWAGNGQIIDDQDRFVFASPATRAALNLYQSLLPYSMKEKQDLLDEAFLNNRLGLEISGSWNLANFPKKAPGLDFGVTLIPAPDRDHGHSASFLGGEVLVLFKRCRNPQAAVKFLRFLARAENTLPITKEALVNFPANKQALSDPFFSKDPKLGVFLKQLETAVHPPVHPLWMDMEKIINTTVERTLYGENADQALKDAGEDFVRAKRSFQARQRPIGTNNSEKTASSSGATPIKSLPGWYGWALSLLAAGGLFYGVLRSLAPLPSRPQALWFLLPWLIAFTVFWLYPLVFSFTLSFCDYDVFHPDHWRFTGLENLQRLLSDPQFRQALGNTLYFVLGTTPVITLLALLLALLIDARQGGETWFRSAFFLPSVISIIVIATIFKGLYSPDGPINTLLSWCGLSPRSWLIEPALALPAIMVMDVWSSAGYYLVLFLAALKAVPRQLYEAAEIDGAGEWGKFRHVTLPQIRPMILFVLVMNTIRAWQVFPEIFTLTRGGPLGTTNTLVHHLYETAFRFHEMGYASAMAYVLVAIILLLSMTQMRLLREKDEPTP